MAFCQRVYGQLWHPTADRRSIVGCNDRPRDHLVASCDRSLLPTTDRTINRGTKQPIILSIVASCDRSYDQSCDYRSAIINNWWCHHTRLVVRSCESYLRPLTIWNRRLEVLNMTIDLVTTEFAYVLSTTCPRFSHVSVAGRT